MDFSAPSARAATAGATTSSIWTCWPGTCGNCRANSSRSACKSMSKRFSRACRSSKEAAGDLAISSLQLLRRQHEFVEALAQEALVAVAGAKGQVIPEQPPLAFQAQGFVSETACVLLGPLEKAVQGLELAGDQVFDFLVAGVEACLDANHGLAANLLRRRQRWFIYGLSA